MIIMPNHFDNTPEIFNLNVPVFVNNIHQYHEGFYDENFEDLLKFYYKPECEEIYPFTFNRIKKSELRILDAGCGFGRDMALFIEFLGAKPVGFDISRKHVEFARRLGLDVAKASFDSYETNEKFDVIWANQSFMHLYPFQIKEIFRKYERMLKPGGYLFCNFMDGCGVSAFDDRFYLDIDLPTMRYIVLATDTLELVDWIQTKGRNKKERFDAAYKTNNQYKLACDLNPKLVIYWNNFLLRKVH